MATWYWGWGYDDWSGGDGGLVLGVGIYDWSGASASSGGGLPHRPSKGSLRPVTEFATVLAAIDENHQGDHVHVTDAKQLSINCFPTGFAQVMAGSFGIHCSIRKSVLFLDVLLDPLSTRGSTWRRYARALQR